MRGMGFRLAAALCVAVVIAPPAAHVVADTCHCFLDREFDPSSPEKTDAYLLATSGNSLLSAAYGVPKDEIVRALMSGTPAADLWVAVFAADRLRGNPAALLAARGKSRAWGEVLRSGAAGRPGGPRFEAALASGASDEELARAAAAETLAARVGTAEVELDALAARGATLQEQVLAAFIGLWSKRAPSAVFDGAKARGSAWSALLKPQGLTPKTVGAAIERSLARPAPGTGASPR